MSRFEECLAVILKFEGGYSNDAQDRGGSTNYGITQKTYSSWLAANNLQDHDVRGIEQEQVCTIYYQNYWHSAGCDEFPEPIDLCVFDCAVNSGVGRAIKTLQVALDVVSDGDFGPHSADALNACIVGGNLAALVQRFLDLRRDFYRDLAHSVPTQNRFLAGWLNRVSALRELCIIRTGG